MSNYMKKFKELTNAVSINIDNYGSDYERKGRIQAATSRFISAASVLPVGEYLGWEIEVRDLDHIVMIAFSSKNVEIVEKDYSWIFKEHLFSLKDSFAPREKSFWEGRHVYMLVAGDANFDKTKRSNRNRSLYEYDYECDYDCVPNYKALLELMQDFEKPYFRILAGSDGNGRCIGTIMISLPEVMPLRMKTMLVMAYQGICVKEVDGNRQELSMKALPAMVISDTMNDMMIALMSVGSVSSNSNAEEGYDSLEELDIDDELLEEDLKFDDIEPEETVEELTKTAMSDGTPIEDLELSVRAYNCLKRAGVTTLGQLRTMSDEELMKVRNLGRKSMEEVKHVLASIPVLAKEAPKVETSYIDALDELIGLNSVKEQIRKISAYARMKQDLKSFGSADVPVVLNMEFVGNPGTAKTTVARILAGIYHEIGLLATPEMVEVGRADLIARYEGQTADKVKNVFSTAKGKLLFIDEAYSLVEQWEGAYGDEAIDTIVQEMENHRDETIVVFAGYPKEMDEFFDRNPGLRSRVPFRIEFSDYTADEMELISEMEARKRGFSIQGQAKEKVTEICKKSKMTVNAGNGRFCRNLVENAILGYASRVYGGNEIPEERNQMLIEEDFSDDILEEEKKAANSIGFCAA